MWQCSAFATAVLFALAAFFVVVEHGDRVEAASEATTCEPIAAGVRPEGTQDYLFEVGNGRDVNHWASEALDAVGVDSEEHAARTMEVMCEIDTVWLALTPSEIEAANEFTGTSPILHGAAATKMSIPAPIDASGPLGGAGTDGTEVIPTGITRIAAPAAAWIGSGHAPSASGVKVGVLDTGTDARHDDLRVVGGYNCTHDARGAEGWGWDGHGHGSHTAGTIGAIANNERFVVGVAPGVALYSIPVLGMDGSGTSATVLCGINKALELGLDIVNLSLGGTHQAAECGGFDPVTNGYCKAINQGLIVVAAAGNDSNDAIAQGPANIPGVLTVSAIVDFDGEPGGNGVGLPGCGLGHRDDYQAVFSSWGSVVEVAGPGGCILSTLPGNTWGYASGTSMATPHVVGVLAAFMARYPDCRGQDAVDAVLQYAERDEWSAEGMPGYWEGDNGPDKEPLIRYVDVDPPTQYGEDADPCKLGTVE